MPNNFPCQQGYLYLWKLPCFETESELAADIVMTLGPFIQVWDELCRLQVIIRSQNKPFGVYNIRNLSFWRSELRGCELARHNPCSRLGSNHHELGRKPYLANSRAFAWLGLTSRVNHLSGQSTWSQLLGSGVAVYTLLPSLSPLLCSPILVAEPELRASIMYKFRIDILPILQVCAVDDHPEVSLSSCVWRWIGGQAWR